jgi:hypothetical protein
MRVQYFAVSALVNGLVDIWVPVLSTDTVLTHDRALEHVDTMSPHHYESLTETNLLEDIKYQRAKAAQHACSRWWGSFRKAFLPEVAIHVFQVRMGEFASILSCCTNDSLTQLQPALALYSAS